MSKEYIHLKTLVLNNNFMPLSVFPLYTIPAQDAIGRVLNGTAELIYAYERPILTPSRDDLFWPSVILNKNSFKYSDKVKLKRETLWYRDHLCCQYCGDPISLSELSIDHVKPKAKGGKHHWNNVVASCYECNFEKSDSEPKGRWKPKNDPYEPNFFQLLDIRKRYPVMVDDPAWEQFLPSWAGNVIVRNPRERVEHKKDEEEYNGIE